MTAIEKPKEATVLTLCEALKGWFGPVLREHGIGDHSNAYWMEAAAAVWIALPDEPSEPDTAKAWQLDRVTA